MIRSKTYAEFWPRYLDEHRLGATRALHLAGTCLGLFLLAAAAALADWRLALAALLCGYAFAWVGHAFVERNRPAPSPIPGGRWSAISGCCSHGWPAGCRQAPNKGPAPAFALSSCPRRSAPNEKGRPEGRPFLTSMGVRA